MSNLCLDNEFKFEFIKTPVSGCLCPYNVKWKKTHVSPLIPNQCITQATCLQTNKSLQDKIHLDCTWIKPKTVSYTHLTLPTNREV